MAMPESPEHAEGFRPLVDRGHRRRHRRLNTRGRKRRYRRIFAWSVLAAVVAVVAMAVLNGASSMVDAVQHFDFRFGR